MIQSKNIKQFWKCHFDIQVVFLHIFLYIFILIDETKLLMFADELWHQSPGGWARLFHQTEQGDCSFFQLFVFRSWGQTLNMLFVLVAEQHADFTGKAALQELKAMGLKRKLSYLSVDTDHVDPEGNETIWHNGQVSWQKLMSGFIVVFLLSPSPSFSSGCGKHNIWSVQLQQPAEPGVRLPACGAGLCGAEGGRGADGQQVPSHSHPGAVSPHRAHPDPAAQQRTDKSLRAACSSAASMINQRLGSRTWCNVCRSGARK